jgi:hypothetical protein
MNAISARLKSSPSVPKTSVKAKVARPSVAAKEARSVRIR